MILLNKFSGLMFLTLTAVTICESKRGSRKKTYRNRSGNEDIFCRNFINPPQQIDIYENNDRFIVAWERPSKSKACDVSYQVTINVDSAAVVNERTKAENVGLTYNFEEDYCSVVEVNVQAISNQIKSTIANEEFMIGSKENCDQTDDSKQASELAQRMAVDPIEENANELLSRMFHTLDEQNGLL